MHDHSVAMIALAGSSGVAIALLTLWLMHLWADLLTKLPH